MLDVSTTSDSFWRDVLGPRDVALAGGALAFFVLYGYAGYALDIVITDPVFDLR